MDIESAKKIAFISCPFDMLVEEHLPLVLQEGINLEIGLSGTILDRFKLPSFKRVARKLESSSLRCTIHAPFIDLSLGAIDSMVRTATIKRLLRAIDIAAVFRAKSMVFHTGFDPKHYHGQKEEWLENCYTTLKLILTHAGLKGIKLNLENVFEYTPEIHQAIFSRFDEPGLGFCFDLGHQKVFSKRGMDEWLEAVGNKIGQLHLHDNNGDWDDHLAIGMGKIDFERVFQYLEKNRLAPLITIEAHKKEDVIPSLEGLSRLLDNHPGLLRAAS